MTVCVAAMGGRNAIFAASDRMLTAGDRTFQPSTAKIFPVTNSIIMMFSGDAGLNGEIRDLVGRDALAQIQAAPETWISVEFVKDLCLKHRAELKAKRAENALLAPMRLNYPEFHRLLAAPQSSDLIKQLARDLINFEMPSISCIVAGVDSDGPHIYSIHDGADTCHNATGFAAIGIGYWHAESEMMAMRHSPTRDSSRTVAAVYGAKRRAEIAPSVGDETDLIMINGLGGYGPVRDDILVKLKELYDQRIRSEETARDGIYQELNKFIDETRQQPPEQEGGPPAA